jgi:hypothetical protein
MHLGSGFMLKTNLLVDVMMKLLSLEKEMVCIELLLYYEHTAHWYAYADERPNEEANQKHPNPPHATQYPSCLK